MMTPNRLKKLFNFTSIEINRDQTVSKEHNTERNG